VYVVYGWPVVACDNPGFLVAYHKNAGGSAPDHIFGRKWLTKAAHVPLALREHT
jgi:hypothetical protein